MTLALSYIHVEGKKKEGAKQDTDFMCLNTIFQSHLEKLEIYVWLAADANTSGTFNLRMPRIALAY